QCNYPPEAAKLPHIGDYRISVEQVVAMKPDLVVAVTSANRSAITQLERLRIPVFSVDPGNIKETFEAIRLIGRITGQEKEANKVVAQMEARAKAVEQRISAEKPRPKVIRVVQYQPHMAPV